MKRAITLGVSFLIVCFFVGLLGCDKGSTAAESGESEEAEAADEEEAVEGDEEGSGDDEETAEEPSSESKDEGAAAREPASAPSDYDPSKLPEGIDAEDPLDKGLSWSDKTGENFLVFTRTERTEEQDEGESRLTTVHLKATHWQKPEDGEWDEVRTYEELVSECSSDAGVTPYLSDWSLTDIDGDDVREATFAWTAGCRSDMSPITHKVLVTEDGEKWVLRGKTAVTTPDEEQVAGELTDDSDFEDADDELRAHADKVWEETSNEILARELDQ